MYERGTSRMKLAALVCTVHVQTTKSTNLLFLINTNMDEEANVGYMFDRWRIRTHRIFRSNFFFIT